MSAVVSAGLSVVFQEFLNKFQKKLDVLKPKDIQIVNVKQDPNTYSLSEIEKVKTTSKKWKNKDNADLIFENILEKESIVKEISLVPDSSFKTKGKIIITIDDSFVFRSRTFDSFENLSDDTIQINKTISQDSKVKIFIISSDGTQVGITAQVTFGD